MTNWYGMLLPAGTPPDSVHALNAALTAVLTQPAIKKKMYDEGMIVVASTPEQFATFLTRETEKFNGIIEHAGIKGSQ
jgi:tripartite-type tricarboxylate transporter receptor subunit TctC